MQPINLSVSTPISDSCSNCFCCFPKKEKKEKNKNLKQEKEKAQDVSQNYFMQTQIDKDYESVQRQIEKMKRSTVETPANSENTSSF